MTNKTYNQYCPVAHTLDIVGERWTLLVIRNLLLGPKRFSDLMKGLPGISTNILSERLKQLEDHQVITTRFLPPPAASTVYLLTESGYALADALGALARWGAQTLGSPSGEQAIVPEAVGFMVLGVFRRPKHPSFNLTCNLHVRHPGFDQHFHIGLTDQGMKLIDETTESATIQIQIDLESLSGLSSGRVRLQDLIEGEQASIDGDAQASAQLVNWIDQRG
ncbi:MAG: helix-turn-helix transcriptional regulator [Anaerolineae bacterium]|nr:helix-turn-helix transcriptional regulator [Anaerolineae bacterium]